MATQPLSAHSAAYPTTPISRPASRPEAPARPERTAPAERAKSEDGLETQLARIFARQAFLAQKAKASPEAKQLAKRGPIRGGRLDILA